MNKKLQIKEAIRVFEENYKEGFSAKEELKANIEGVMVFIKIVEPENKELIDLIKAEYRNIVNS